MHIVQLMPLPPQTAAVTGSAQTCVLVSFDFGSQRHNYIGITGMRIRLFVGRCVCVYVLLDSHKTVEGSTAAFIAQLMSVMVINRIGELY